MAHREVDSTPPAWEQSDQQIQGYAPAIHIPTDDPAAALEFCRRLAVLLDATVAADTLPVAPIGAANVALVRQHDQLARPDVSVVIPVFNEEANLASLHARLIAALAPLGLSY